MRLNLGGYKWLWYDGYGRFSLNSAKALIRAGHDVYPFELETLEKPAWYLRAQGMDFGRLTIQLAPPHNMQHVPGRSVAWTMHESMNLPDGWVEHVNSKNQLLLVPSPWLIEVFEDAGVEIPIEVVPGGIDPEECHVRQVSRNTPYTFLCLGDRGNRKGYDLVWTAFYKIFNFNNRNVRLIIKCRPGSLEGLSYSYSTDDRLTLWRADVQNIADIWAQADAFIFPTRCEGYGMPPREAAACGVPTVATRWSGTADDADDWQFPLNDFQLVESHMEDCGGKWAQPSLDEVCEKMLWLYENQDEARQQALIKAKWLREHATYDHAAVTLVDTLGKYFGRVPPPRDPDLAPWDVLKSNGHKPKELILNE